MERARVLIGAPRAASGGTSGALDVRPWILALESVLEVKDVGEVILRVMRLAEQQAGVNEREDDSTDIRRASDSPVREYQTGHDAITVQRKRAAPLGQLASGNVPSLLEPRLAEFQGTEHEEIRVLVKSRLTKADAIHDSIAERQL